MAFKRNLTPLGSSGLVTEQQRAVLASSGITTVEELAGALAADPHALATMLDLDPTEVHALTDRAMASLPAGTRAKLAKPVPRPTFGAIDPARRPK
jgi:predicted RecB family nuclease